MVMRADQAARALERAWRHWRRLHGLSCDSMLPVSSYVGYSPSEPWGQPRVVFGMAADDAAALTFFLEGHDCVGPVHAAVASLPGAQPGAPVTAAQVPGQDVKGPGGADRPARLRPPRGPDPLDPAQIVEFADPHGVRELDRAGTAGESDGVGIRRPAKVADNQDGPVFRQMATALAAPATQVVPVTRVDLARADNQTAAEPAAAMPPLSGEDQGTAGFKPIGRFPLPGEPAVPAQRPRKGSREPAGPRPAVGARLAEAEPPGPLALAAATAQAAAEARIRAAGLGTQPGEGLSDPYDSSRAASGRSRHGGRGLHEADIYAQARGSKPGPGETRPSAEGGAGRSDPGLSGPGVRGPLASYLDQGPESSDFFD